MKLLFVVSNTHFRWCSALLTTPQDRLKQDRARFDTRATRDGQRLRDTQAKWNAMSDGFPKRLEVRRGREEKTVKTRTENDTLIYVDVRAYTVVTYCTPDWLVVVQRRAHEPCKYIVRYRTLEKSKNGLSNDYSDW